MTTLLSIGFYLFSVCSVIFLMKLYIKVEGTIDEFIVWGSFVLSLIPGVNLIVSLIYFVFISILFSSKKLEERRKRRVKENRRSFVEHLLGVEKKTGYHGDSFYKYVKKEK